VADEGSYQPKLVVGEREKVVTVADDLVVLDFEGAWA
jgi:hypothetical protein